LISATVLQYLYSLILYSIFLLMRCALRTSDSVARNEHGHGEERSGIALAVLESHYGHLGFLPCTVSRSIPLSARPPIVFSAASERFLNALAVQKLANPILSKMVLLVLRRP